MNKYEGNVEFIRLHEPLAHAPYPRAAPAPTSPSFTSEKERESSTRARAPVPGWQPRNANKHPAQVRLVAVLSVVWTAGGAVSMRTANILFLSFDSRASGHFHVAV